MKYPVPPLLDHKHYDEATVFVPESLLREARRQKGLKDGLVPKVCVLEPDGDMSATRSLQVLPSAIPIGPATIPNSIG